MRRAALAFEERCDGRFGFFNHLRHTQFGIRLGGERFGGFVERAAQPMLLNREAGTAIDPLPASALT